MDDNELQSKVDTLMVCIDDNETLDSVVSSVFVDQLDALDDRESNQFTLFLREDSSSLAKATVINELVFNSDIDVKMASTAEGHEQLTFKFIEA